MWAKPGRGIHCYYISIMAAFLCARVAMGATYGGGSGTPGDPYQIWTPEQMNTIGANPDDWGSHFKLMANIDMSAYTGTQYNIIGNWAKKFTGAFYGNGHVISNLTFTTNEVFDFVGLFGCTDYATIQNLGVENVSLSSGGSWIGSLVGCNLSGKFISCYATGSVCGRSFVGGLVGWNSGTLTACYATGSVTGWGYYVGGLVGYHYSGTIISCYVTGSVSVTGTGFYIGGLVGRSDGEGIICQTVCGEGDCWEECSMATVEAPWLVKNSFWDMQMSGQTNSSGGIGKTTVEMMILSTFTSAGWDFTNEILNGTADVWRMCTDGVDYPRLNWESIDGDLACPDGVKMEDLDFFVGWWLKNCSETNAYCGGADLDFSGSVNLADLTILAANWMRQ